MSNPQVSNSLMDVAEGSLDGQTPGKAVGVSGITHVFAQGRDAVPLTVLDSVDLTVEPGEFVSIVGQSGCGKSTLLRIMSGLLPATEGSAFLGKDRIRAPRREIGMVFQSDAVFPWLTVRRNIEYGLHDSGLSATERADVVRGMCELVGLERFQDSYPKELSGGMRKRVDLARMYARDPDVLLMDEPFGALDAQTKNRMQEEILRIWQQRRKTVVFVTHDLDEATFLSDRVVVMSARPGRVFESVDIDLPRPRTDAMRVEEVFLEAKRRLWEAFQGANER